MRSVCDYFEQLEQQDVIPSVAPGDVGKLIPRESLYRLLGQMLNRGALQRVLPWKERSGAPSRRTLSGSSCLGELRVSLVEI